MSSTASTTSPSPSPDPASGTAATVHEHDAADATVTEQPVTSFTDRVKAKAAETAAEPSTAEPSTTGPATPEPTRSEPGRVATASGPPQGAQQASRERRSPDLRAGARRAATLTKSGVNRLRTLLGQIVWIVCLLGAAALLLGTAVVVLEANTRNALVEGVLKAADWADLGVFSRTAGIKQFTGENALIKNAFVNWGLGAIVWLVVGRIARRILTP